MSEVKITALENGPLQVDGDCTVLASDGTVVKEAAKVFLCRCGHSANKPMCDGSHELTLQRGDGAQTAAENL